MHRSREKTVIPQKAHPNCLDIICLYKIAFNTTMIDWTNPLQATFTTEGTDYHEKSTKQKKLVPSICCTMQNYALEVGYASFTSYLERGSARKYNPNKLWIISCKIISNVQSLQLFTGVFEFDCLMCISQNKDPEKDTDKMMVALQNYGRNLSMTLLL